MHTLTTKNCHLSLMTGWAKSSFVLPKKKISFAGEKITELRITYFFLFLNLKFRGWFFIFVKYKSTCILINLKCGEDEI